MKNLVKSIVNDDGCTTTDIKIFIIKCKKGEIKTNREGNMGSHLFTDHGLQRGVLVLKRRGGRRRVVGQEVIIVVVPGQPFGHLLNVLTQRCDGLSNEKQNYEPETVRSFHFNCYVVVNS